MRGVFVFCSIVITFILFSIAGAYAIGNCPDDQAILNLSGTTNAHGANFNSNYNYPVRICYGDLFQGSVYPSMPDPHLSSGTNTVLKLSSAGNAHASGPTGNYQTVVSYGDLKCRLVTSTTSPDSSNREVEVVYLSGTTNAHLQMPGQANPYPFKILCYSPYANAPSNVGFKNNLNNPVVSSCVGGTVKLYALTAFPVGSEVDFIVWESVSGGFDKKIKEVKNITNADGSAIFSWQIASTDLSASSSTIVKTYLEVKRIDTSLSSIPKYLFVNKNSCVNEKPIASISKPENIQTYFAGTNINFESNSFDPDGEIVAYNWTVSYNGAREFVSNDMSFMHNFPTDKPGERIITLRVTDDRGEWDEEQAAIVVVASPGLISYISQPLHHQTISGLNVVYSGNRSYILNSTINLNNCAGEIYCIAGMCPAFTANAPISCATDKIEIKNHDKPLSLFFFNWTFIDEGVSYQGFGNAQGVKPYGTPSYSLNDKKIRLNLSFSDGNIMKSEVFERTFTILTRSQCLLGSNMLVKTDANGFIVSNKSISSGGGCVGPDETVGTGDDCCPGVGQICVSRNGGIPACEIASESYFKCSDYTEKNACQQDVYGVSDPQRNSDNPEINSNSACGSYVLGSRVQCSGCVWDNSQTETGKYCKLNKTYIKEDNSVSSGCFQGTCKVGFTEIGTCSAGYQTGQITKVFSAGNCGIDPVAAGLCTDEDPKQYLCGRPKLSLPFFGFWQALISLTGIFTIYFLFGLAKKTNKT